MSTLRGRAKRVQVPILSACEPDALFRKRTHFFVFAGTLLPGPFLSYLRMDYNAFALSSTVCSVCWLLTVDIREGGGKKMEVLAVFAHGFFVGVHHLFCNLDDVFIGIAVLGIAGVADCGRNLYG